MEGPPKGKKKKVGDGVQMKVSANGNGVKCGRVRSVSVCMTEGNLKMTRAFFSTPEKKGAM
jgi:hypothetical protein